MNNKQECCEGSPYQWRRVVSAVVDCGPSGGCWAISLSPEDYEHLLQTELILPDWKDILQEISS